jgi:hypothetical protein
VSNDVVCIAYPSGQVIGRAQVPLESDSRPSLIVDDDQLFVARNGQVAALTLDGRPLWMQSLGHAAKGLIPTALGVPGQVRQADDRSGRLDQ